MSGHSKWAQIHRQKGTADTKRGALFTRLGNAITAAAKTGGGNVENNFKLRLTIDQAKAANMPKDNIERAIKRGTGELAGAKVEAIAYEGFGPGKAAFIIEVLTDNRNRTSSAIKHLLTKHGGSLGGPNSVAWMFELKGVIRIKEINEELELALIDAGVQDISQDQDGVIIYTKPAELQKIKELLENKGKKIESAQIDYIAKEKKLLNQEEQQQLEQLISELEENEDINDYYTNAEIKEK